MSTQMKTNQIPKMLKDFLQDNNLNPNNSNSYSPTRPETNNNSDPNQPSVNSTLLKTRSKSRATTEAIGKLLNNAIRAFHSSSSTPLTLHTSVSRRSSGIGMMRNWFKKMEKSRCSSEVMNGEIVVVALKVKDILRWRSFRDLVMDDNHVNDDHNDGDDDDDEEVGRLQPLDYGVGPMDEAPKNSDVGVALDTDVGPKKDNQNMASEEEIEQQSPVSILESPFRDEVSDEEFLSSFDQSLANMERTKQRLLQSIQLFESLAGVYEEDGVKEEEEEECEVDNLNEAYKSKAYLVRGLFWFKRGVKGLEDKLECIKVMDEQRHWGKFQEERVELGVDLEVELLSDMLDEVLIDFCG